MELISLNNLNNELIIKSWNYNPDASMIDLD